MNIGFVSEALPYLPSVGGFRLYGANLIRHLAPRHQIDLVSLLTEDDHVHLAWAGQYCRSVQTIPVKGAGLVPRLANLISTYGWGRPLHPRQALASALERGLQERRWDVLHIEGAYAGALVDPRLRVAKILSAHDSRTLRSREMQACATTLREKTYHRLLRFVQPRYEGLVYPRFDCCVFVAPRDVQAAREVAPGIRTALIPNGVDTEHFHPMNVPKESATLVFHGHLGYVPNVSAAVDFADSIFPLVRQQMPEAIFHMVGADPHPRITALRSRPGIRVSANLPDLRPALCSGSVYVCAVRHGTGVKNKLLEAMAMRMPIVSTPSAIAGIEVVPGTHLLAADDPATFAGHIVGLLRDPGAAGRLASAGRRLVEDQYSWSSRAHDFERLYEGAIHERHAGRIPSGYRS